MKKNYVADDKVILNLSGLRFIQKRDAGSHIEEIYFLEWEYKGSKGSAYYDDKSKRDAMYNKVLASLTENTPILQSQP
jgi:hypothetical protein